MSFQNLPHPRALAFLGDAVYEILLREWAVAEGLSQSKDLHAFTTAMAKAETQVALLYHLKSHLSENEWDIVRQGRNADTGRSKQSAHRQATGLEALIGALHLQQPQRLLEIWMLAKPFLRGTLPEQASF